MKYLRYLFNATLATFLVVGLSSASHPTTDDFLSNVPTSEDDPE